MTPPKTKLTIQQTKKNYSTQKILTDMKISSFIVEEWLTKG